MPNAIDVFQRYQGAIDWPQVARDGVRYAFIKLTNGNAYASPAGDAYATGCRSVGIVPGGYHYALGSSTPEAQADLFAVELLRLHCLDIAPALDYEDASLPRDATGAQRWIEHFFTRLRTRLTWLTKVLLYSSGSELNQIHAQAITVLGLAVLEWDAEYGPNDGSEHPINTYIGTAAIHQYTSVGRLSGIAGAVDEDDVTADITLRPPSPAPVPAPITPGADMPSFNRTCAAGVNEHADLCVAGCTELYLSCSWRQAVTVHDLLFWGPTPAAASPAATGVGGGYAEAGHNGQPCRFDSNRPGPIPIPPGAATVTVRYDADHDFDLAAR